MSTCHRADISGRDSPLSHTGHPTNALGRVLLPVRVLRPTMDWLQASDDETNPTVQ